MTNDKIKDLERHLLNDWETYSGDLSLNMIREIVDALKEGQVWYERFNRLESHIKRQAEIEFFEHYTMSNILNLIQNIKDTHSLDKQPETFESMTEKLVWDSMKKILSAYLIR